MISGTKYPIPKVHSSIDVYVITGPSRFSSGISLDDRLNYKTLEFDLTVRKNTKLDRFENRTTSNRVQIQVNWRTFSDTIETKSQILLADEPLLWTGKSRNQDSQRSLIYTRTDNDTGSVEHVAKHSDFYGFRNENKGDGRRTCYSDKRLEDSSNVAAVSTKKTPAVLVKPIYFPICESVIVFCTL